MSNLEFSQLNNNKKLTLIYEDKSQSCALFVVKTQRDNVYHRTTVHIEI